MASADVRLPDLGEGLTEATVVRWRVAVGDVVATDQVVAEVETAKATVELPAPFSGTVTARHVEEGDEVAVGAALLSLDQDRAGPVAEEPPGSVLPAGDVPSEEGEREDASEPAGGDQDGTKLLVGLGPAEPRSRRRRARAAGRERAQHRETPARARRPRAKPPVRKLAKDLGVDLADLSGSGPDGRITRDDVHAAAALAVPEPDQAADGARGRASVSEPAGGDQGGRASVSEPAGGDQGGRVSVSEPADVQRIDVTGVRARIAEHLSVAWREIPAAACWVECDASALMALRDELAAAHPEVKLTPLAIMLRCCVVALRDVPQLNASFDAQARQIVQHEAIHLGIATQTDRGLVVPVVRDAGGRSVLDLATAVRSVATQARDNTLTPAQMVGGTFTVSSFGAFGVDGGTPIINHPQAAILGIGQVRPRPWVVGDRVEVRQIVQLSLTFDHRVCDGAEAATYLRRLADLMERPTLLLAH